MVGKRKAMTQEEDEGMVVSSSLYCTENNENNPSSVPSTHSTDFYSLSDDFFYNNPHTKQEQQYTTSEISPPRDVLSPLILDQPKSSYSSHSSTKSLDPFPFSTSSLSNCDFPLMMRGTSVLLVAVR